MKVHHQDEVINGDKAEADQSLYDMKETKPNQDIEINTNVLMSPSNDGNIDPTIVKSETEKAESSSF